MKLAHHLEKSDFFLSDRLSRALTPKRLLSYVAQLSPETWAEFHVVKNTSLRLAAKEKNLPDLGEFLSGHTAIVVGGDDASGVAKDLGKYFKSKEKVSVKAGVLGDRALNAQEVKKLAQLPSLEIIRAQLLSLVNTPATQVVSILNQPARGLLNVLQAKTKDS